MRQAYQSPSLYPDALRHSVQQHNRKNFTFNSFELEEKQRRYAVICECFPENLDHQFDAFAWRIWTERTCSSCAENPAHFTTGQKNAEDGAG